MLTIDSTGDMGRQQTYTLAGTDKSIELSHKGIGCVDILLLSKWLTIPAVATAALLSLRGANYGDVYAVGDRVFRVKAPHGGDSVSFHNSPHADDRCEKVFQLRLRQSTSPSKRSMVGCVSPKTSGCQRCR